MVGFALDYCDVDDDEGTSDKLVKKDGAFLQHTYGSLDCSGDISETTTYTNQVCQAFGGGRASTAVFDTPISFASATQSGATAVIAGWGMVVLMAAVALQ